MIALVRLGGKGGAVCLWRRKLLHSWGTRCWQTSSLYITSLDGFKPSAWKLLSKLWASFNMLLALFLWFRTCQHWEACLHSELGFNYCNSITAQAVVNLNSFVFVVWTAKDCLPLPSITKMSWINLFLDILHKWAGAGVTERGWIFNSCS